MFQAVECFNIGSSPRGTRIQCPNDDGQRAGEAVGAMDIAVCEDAQLYVDEMLGFIDNWIRINGHTDVHTTVYASADDLWDDWEKGKIFDALFLDIHFEYMSGFELAQRVRETDLNIPIIFVTNDNRYLRLGYEVSAYRYLKKPIRENEVHACLDYCFDRRNTSAILHQSFLITKQGFSIRMPYQDVLYIVSGIHSVKIVTRFGREYAMPLKGAFGKYAETFPSDLFVRCHRGYILNIAYAVKYTKKAITLTNGFEVPIGKTYAEEALKSLKDFFYKAVSK